MPIFSVIMQDIGILNAKKWCVKCQFRHLKCQKLFMKLTPGCFSQKVTNARIDQAIKKCIYLSDLYLINDTKFIKEIGKPR